MRILLPNCLMTMLMGFMLQANAQSCLQTPDAFQVGESVTYQIYYNWKAIWVKAGEVTFKVKDTTFLKKSMLLFDGNGTTLKKWDWFYKVRDHYWAIAEKDKLRSRYFYRDVKEGGFEITEKYLFDHRHNVVYTGIKPKKELWQADTVKINQCTLDPLTMIYYARCIDYSKYQPGDKIPISIFIDNKEYASYIRYIGKEAYEVKGLGTVNTIKFKPLLIEGTIFNGGEEMTVWVTDDENKVPVQIESEILVGSIKATILQYEGLKFPFIKVQETK